MSGDPVRVLHLRGSCGLYGAERVILGLARHQPALGFDPTVMDFRRPGDAPGPFLDAAREQGCRALPLPCRGRLDVSAWRSLRTICRTERIQVLHAHDYKGVFYSVLAACRLPIALVATSHGWDWHNVRLSRYCMLNSYLLRRFHRVIAVADPVATDLRDRGVDAERITVIPNGSDIADRGLPTLSLPELRSLKRELGLPENATTIGTVGRLEPVKGHDLLLEAFAWILPKEENAHLVIVGDGSLRGELQELAHRLGIKDRVAFLGERSDVQRLLRLFALYVCPSRSEGLPIAVLEAAGAGLPIVATRVGDIPGLVIDRQTGVLVPAEDIRALANAMVEMLAFPERARALGRAAAIRVRDHLSIRTTAERHCEVYRLALTDVGRHWPPGPN